MPQTPMDSKLILLSLSSVSDLLLSTSFTILGSIASGSKTSSTSDAVPREVWARFAGCFHGLGVGRTSSSSEPESSWSLSSDGGGAFLFWPIVHGLVVHFVPDLVAGLGLRDCFVLEPEDVFFLERPLAGAMRGDVVQDLELYIVEYWLKYTWST